MCECCEKNTAQTTVEIFEPFEDKGYVMDICTDCDERGDATSDSFYCQSCGRYIYFNNGMRDNMRTFYGTPDYSCVACWQKHALKDGMDPDDFEGDTMRGDFFNDDDLVKAGFEKTGFSPFVSSQTGAGMVNAYCRQMLAEGRKVVLCYERLSMLGDEGDVAVWTR